MGIVICSKGLSANYYSAPPTFSIGLILDIGIIYISLIYRYTNILSYTLLFEVCYINISESYQ